jgi:hypothetical protein
MNVKPKTKKPTVKAKAKPREPLEIRKNKIQQVKKALLEAMQKSYGVVSTACKMANLDRTTFYNHYNDDPEFKKACDECSEIALDEVEMALYKQIESGVPSSTIFYLKTKGRKRGYKEESPFAFGNQAPNLDEAI